MVDYICTACGYVGHPKVLLRGSRSVEIGIWAMLIFPGPFYSFYRHCGARRFCTHCGTEGMLSTKSLEGFELMKRAERGEVSFELEHKIYGMGTPAIEENEGSFKGCIVQRDIRSEIQSLAAQKQSQDGRKE